MAKKTFLLCLLFLFFLSVQAAESSHKGGLLDIHPGLGVWTIVTFVVLAILLKKFAWKPLLHAIEEREKHIQDSIQNSQKSQKEAMELVEESKKNLSKAKQEAEALLQQTQERSQKVRKEALLLTERDCAEIKYNTQKEMHEMLQSFFFSQTVLIGDLGLEIASELIHRTLNKEDHKNLLEEAIDSIQKRMETQK